MEDGKESCREVARGWRPRAGVWTPWRKRIREDEAVNDEAGG